MDSEIIEQQEESQDLVILANSDSSSSFIGIEEELDPITEAIRQEILLKQRDILRKYIAENLDLTVNHCDDQEFAHYLKNVNNRVIVNQAFLDPKVKVEIEGYKKVHHNFTDRFQTINWQNSDKEENIREQVIKNDEGNQLATIRETTHKINEVMFLSDGTTRQINSYRTINFPTRLK